VNPSVDEDEMEYASRELSNVAIVVISQEDGTALDAMTKLAHSKKAMQIENADVVVEVFMKSPPLLAGDSDDGVERLAVKEPFTTEHTQDVRPLGEPATQPSPRILYINGFPLRNTILV
jgi:hypothetical protein